VQPVEGAAEVEQLLLEELAAAGADANKEAAAIVIASVEALARRNELRFIFIFCSEEC
jgi:hypothetical protein